MYANIFDFCKSLNREHKMQQMKRLGVGSGSEEDPTHSGEFLNVHFLNVKY